jgi:hypothetical protein
MRDKHGLKEILTKNPCTLPAGDTNKRGLVGARGFEPPTSCSQSRRATGLRYAPTVELQELTHCPDASKESGVITVLALYL